MLGNIGVPLRTTFSAFQRTGKLKYGKVTIFNNTFYGTDGAALLFAGESVLSEFKVFYHSHLALRAYEPL